MDAGKAFTFVFDDRDWLVKILIGGGILLIGMVVPIVGWILAPAVINGFTLQATRNIINRSPSPMPEWNEFGEKLVNGLALYAIQIIWTIPAFILFGLASVSGIFADPNLVGRGTEIIGIFLASGFGLAGFVYLLFYWVTIPIATARYAASLRFGTAFDIREIFRTLTQNGGNYAVVIGLSIVAGFIAMLGIVGLFIGVVFTAFYSYLIIAGLYGYAYRDAVDHDPTLAP